MERARKLLRFDDTELRLGLPGATDRSVGKRGFDETSGSLGFDLNLNLNFSKEALMDEIEKIKEKKCFVGSKPAVADPSKPPAAKTQVVGWPPVRASRKSMVTITQTQKKDESSKSSSVATGVAGYVKVSMDGAPYLRKVDLKMYRSYQELSAALVKMFDSFIAGNSGFQSPRTRDFLSENMTVNLQNGSKFVSTFEDKDGDWMFVGDVTWEMFVDSCKRLRIIKGSDAIGLGTGRSRDSH